MQAHQGWTAVPNWAKESSPGQSGGLDPCDALGQRISNDSPRAGVGNASPAFPTPTRGENLGNYGLSTQGVAAGSRLRLLLFVRYALGYLPMAFQAILRKGLANANLPLTPVILSRRERVAKGRVRRWFIVSVLPQFGMSHLSGKCLFRFRLQTILFIIPLAISLNLSVSAQQRPLQTQDPTIIAPGNLLMEFGFDFQQDAHFPQSGLTGDLTSIGIVGVNVGLGKIVEFQLQGTVQDFLSVNSKEPAPINPELNVSGTGTHDFGDLVLSTKILIVPEKDHLFSLGFRPSVQLPNGSSVKGLGMNSTQFFGTFTAGRHLGKLNAFGNLGLGILSNPINAGSQNDVLIYGMAGIYPLTSKVNLASEVFGRWSTRKSPPLGTESRSQLRVGLQIYAVGFRWDIGGLAGLAKTSPRSGVTIGITREFHAFKL